MSEKVIRKSKREFTGYITLNRPEVYNTFTSEYAELLNSALIAFDADSSVRVVVINAEGKNFSTGIDLGEFDEKSPNDYREFIALMDKHNHTIAKMKKPVISSVQGYCLANGAGLSFAADLTVAAESARFGTTAVNVGLICTGPGVPLIANVGRKKAMEMVLLGEMVTAQEALELGLVNWVVPDDELEMRTDEIAKKLASKSPLAVAAGKRGLSAAYDVSYSAGVDYGSEMFASLCSSHDAKEGIKAFQEKRKPKWSLK
ncbi:Enoyl-CoA hydratase/isomerase [Denitrovibrio acetiphilus DSM 12809]|uniref:Enoyl-CoA hydratase/isomerase n=1 Tax=Denitrovibrio acetiphilus (strain DSM 12809 / NBRC 114555 / N2460) TaxID=522772 RepID=D4H4H2_DENA2|nr:enoyl-CoA hydratase/isomerase family protein [Denitrovibrio acetiphilus]ADD69301.1 Enoyl-CoA hydratase/isomerase [Denitrovibrio acetiphilus DSM 12809]